MIQPAAGKRHGCSAAFIVNGLPWDENDLVK
ncbi:hypothetical protein B23_3726 [Geobacillus thermoleovorans B23]|nr:hypothetical protein B23_3726 [Geobacillus thermoleovorans B23]